MAEPRHTLADRVEALDWQATDILQSRIPATKRRELLRLLSEQQQLLKVAVNAHDALLRERDVLRAVLVELVINANRLCDRMYGGTYEEDCRRSIAKADAALQSAAPSQETV